jgi:hypothetical protein
MNATQALGGLVLSGCLLGLCASAFVASEGELVSAA